MLRWSLVRYSEQRVRILASNTDSFGSWQRSRLIWKFRHFDEGPTSAFVGLGFRFFETTLAGGSTTFPYVSYNSLRHERLRSRILLHACRLCSNGSNVLGYTDSSSRTSNLWTQVLFDTHHEIKSIWLFRLTSSKSNNLTEYLG